MSCRLRLPLYKCTADVVTACQRRVSAYVCVSISVLSIPIYDSHRQLSIVVTHSLVSAREHPGGNGSMGPEY